MHKIRSILFTAIALMVCLASSSFAENAGRFGARAGIGTDINGGIAYGGGINYAIPVQKNHFELGIVLFGGSFDETSDNGFNTYDETTDVFVFGLLANYLIGYDPEASGPFFIAGLGLGSISVEWEERSATDVSLGTPLPGGGSMQAEEGSAGGSIFNFGVGTTFKGGFDIRAEVPIIVSFSAPGESASVIPTIIATAGYRF